MFCRIYLAGKDIRTANLLKSISELLNAKLIDNSYVEMNGYSIELRVNENYNNDKSKAFPDGFLHFPLCVEIDMSNSVSEIEASKVVSQILVFLWKSNWSAIASCDFENLLPENGGYMSRSIPWIS